MTDGMVAADAIDGVWFAADGSTGDRHRPRIIVTHRSEDGDADLAFGRDGEKTYRVSGHGQLHDVRLSAALPLADGGVQIAGQMGRGYGGSREYSLMVRLAASGAYDTSLGGAGQAQSRVRSRSDSPALLAADGSWYFAILGRKGSLRVTHMTRDGAVDRSYGASGVAVVRSGRHWSFSDVQSLGAAPDGGLYVVAPTKDFDGLTRPVRVVKLTTTGEVATGYGHDGFATTPPAWGDVFAFGAAFGADGRIVMACKSDEEGTYPCVVAMGPDGFADSEFGVAGRAVTKFDQLPPYIYWSRLVVDRDGGIYEAATGYSLPFAHRWTADGRVDRSFGTDGIVTGSTRTESVIGAVALDHQGRLLVTAGGSAWDGSGEITRFLVD